jgi:hypothetical protein
MTELFIAFLAGALAGYWARPKDPELKQQTDLYNRTYQKYEQEIKYYKDLCKWHAERNQEEKK